MSERNTLTCPSTVAVGSTPVVSYCFNVSTCVEPTATVLGQVNVFRSDIARPSLSVERAVANAPESADGFFVVPKIIEDRQPL